MNTWVRRSLSAGALTAGAVMAAGATAAHADTTMISSDNTGILNGTQVFAPIQAPINLCGVAAGVVGQASAGCVGGSAASLHGLYDVTMISHDNTGILNGTQAYLPIQAPINVCGVAVSVLGEAFAACEGGASATQGGDSHHRKSGHDGYHKKGKKTKGHARHDGPGVGYHAEPAAEVLSGNLAGLPTTNLLSGLPLVGGLTQGGGGLLGGGPLGGGPLTESGRTEGVRAGAGEGGGDQIKRETPRPSRDWDGHRRHGDRDVTMISKDNTGILNGTQIHAPIQVPIDVSGVAAAVLGQASAWSTGGSSARN